MEAFTVYNFPPQPPNYDRIGVFYISYAVIWSTLVACGFAFLIWHRQNPILKIRGLWLSLPAVAMLHAYWILAQLVYPVGMTMNLVLAYDIQYFFMGIWLPLGIALFHASNTRFLHVAKLQKKYVETTVPRKGCNGANSSWLCRFRNMEYWRRVLVFIIIGMVFQTLLTVGMWLACKKYHPTFGVDGTELPDAPLQVQLVELGRGWEWWPTVVWQVVWTWIVAPYMLIKAWHIDDTLGWRVQTVACCLASLHATPMFLIASYVDAFLPINAYFPPSQWIHLSTMVFEIFTIFVPCYLVVRHRSLQKQAIASNEKWETLSQTSSTLAGSFIGSAYKKVSLSVSVAEETQIRNDILYLDDDRLFTMSALEHVLRTNPAPLQKFSALRDFSGENIVFLAQTTMWKEMWQPGQELNEYETRRLFIRALEMYTTLISPRDAEFPINLSSKQLKDLEEVFEKPARIICGDARVDPATPFAFEGPPSSSGSDEKNDGHLDLREVSNRIHYTGPIGPSFGPDVFDEARKHVKYLVFTNTWPKFVNELRKTRQSGETERTHSSSGSQRTLVGRALGFVRSKM